MKGNDYQTAVSIFYVTFLIFEVPSNLVLKRFTPSRLLSGLTVCWGIIATLTGLCHTYGELIACRLLLGVVISPLLLNHRRMAQLKLTYLFPIVRCGPVSPLQRLGRFLRLTSSCRM